MQPLILHHESMLSGNFKRSSVNFLFVFQVNCPGCFLYGIPLVNALYEEFGNEVSFLGLSTAFEDYNYNTSDNTKALISNGELIGETKKALKQHGLDSYPNPLVFPIAMDKKSDDSFNFKEAAEQICQSSSRYQMSSEEEQIPFLNQVIHYLKNQPQLSLTFTLNQLRGTPTFIIFNENYDMLYHQFGHVEYQTLQLQLKECLTKTKP
ncbi:hypothetical protein [Spongiimicrobium salis]|uniref:hypothetical protein n=1 Tax=Spongiimicrobium salis TaxID=1667022 RepID=UPI00374CC318